jgi:hypothetical protein
VSGVLNVHLRVTDAATAQPTSVRLRISGPGGESYPPLGRFAEFPIGRGEAVGGQVLLATERHYYVDGSCEIQLPTGVPLQIAISKGLEYQPIRDTMTLGAGQMSLRFRIERWTNLREQGWHSGDSRAHFLTPHAALLEAQAEDLAVVNLLATVHDFPSQDGKLYPVANGIDAFSGNEPALESAGHLIVVNTFNTHPVLGRLGLLNCHRPIFPLTFGGPHGSDDWSLCDWCDQCHRKQGLVVWADAYRPDAGLAGGEGLIALLLKKVDALEFDARERSQPLLPVWYRLLNAGLPVPAVGGSAKDSNRIALGGMRTYALLDRDEPLTYRAWIEAVRQGRTFVTNGPLLRFSVNGMPPGARIDPEPGTASLRIEAAAESWEKFDKLQVVANGAVIAESPASGSPYAARIEIEHRLPEGGWLAARCWAAQRGELYPHVPLFAHSSPVFVQTASGQYRRDVAAVRPLREQVLATRDWIEREGRFEKPRSREHLLALTDQALAALT